MNTEGIREILQKGEGIEIEFKTSQFELNRDVFESICAFLNRKGGHLLLGVNNDGVVEGVIEGAVQRMVNTVVTSANNPQKLLPPVYLSTHVIDYKGTKVVEVLRIYPPTKPGHRSMKNVRTTLASPERDLGLGLEQITEDAKKRYDI